MNQLTMIIQPCHRCVRIAVALVIGLLIVQSDAFGQQRRGPANQQKSSVPKRGSGDAADRKALAYYANAADYQNNGAFELAIEEWQKLVKEYPRHPQASAAWHHMGVCQLQRKEPDYGKAVEAFEQALKDEELELREESLINLSWALVTQARGMEAGSAVQREGYVQARDRMLEFIKRYGDGDYVDQALFYLGDVEHILGDRKRSIAYFRKFLQTKSLAKSSLRPDAVYALAVAYEEEQDFPEAKRRYNEFLTEYSEHRLANEVRLRIADILLRENKPQEAERLLTSIVTSDEASMADYALLRLGYALSQQGDQGKAVEQYSRLVTRFPNSPHVPAASLSLGQSQYQLGKYDEAVTSFASLVEQDVPQSADAAHWLAITYMRQNKPQEALDMLTKVLDKVAGSPIGPAIQLDYADALYAIPGKLEESRAAYEKFATENANDPLAPRAAYNAAFAALQGGKFADARRWAETFLEKYPEDPLRNEVAYIAAESLLQQGEHQAAAEAYGKLLKADSNHPNSVLWKLRLGLANYSARKYDAAIALLTPLLDQFKQSPQQLAEAQFILGGSYLNLEKNEEAIKWLETSHASSDRWALADEVLSLLAEAYQRSKNNAKAKETLELLLQKYPNSRLKGQAEYKLAQLSAAMGNLDEAIRRYRSVVDDESATSFHHFAAYGIAWSLMQQDKYAEALEMLQPLVTQQPRDAIADEAQLAIGVCQRKLGQLDQALASLEKFLATSPSGTSLANGMYELGLAYTEQGQLESANAQFQRIVKEYPAYPSLDKVLYELAWNHQEIGQDGQAAEYFTSLLSKFPTSEFAGEARYMRAERLYEDEEYDAAARLYEEVLNGTDDDGLLEKAQYKLGWSLFQQKQFDQAAANFSRQAQQFPVGPLAVDALFMQGESAFKQDQFEEALRGFEKAREQLEKGADSSSASPQVRSLIYLHGGQALRELKRWDECETWLKVVIERYTESPHLPTALYELGYCKQNQNKLQEALTHYAEVAEAYRTEVAARARFMMGEVYFSQRDFVKAIPEFQRVMFGFGGEKASDEIKNWQAKSAFEAARCAEVLLENLNGNARQKVVDTAKEFYEFIVQKHGSHELAAQAQNRLGELKKLR